MVKTLLLATAFLLSTAAPASAAIPPPVSCGDTITGPAMMTSDLSCGSDDPALTINGGTLNMKGHKVSGCLGDGIKLIGSGSRLGNGVVDGCSASPRSYSSASPISGEGASIALAPAALSRGS